MKTKRQYQGVMLLAMLMLVFTQVKPAQADGGIIIPDRDVWSMIQEGQQIAVVQLKDENTVLVNLFISMIDRSGSSHQVIFFVPLGKQASQFHVVEESSLDFDKALTKSLDDEIEAYTRRQANYADDVHTGLLVGTLATNGLWTWLISLPLLASGCATAPPPKATFETASSVISIYDLDQQTDVTGLIETTGLDPSVQQTLESLRGQEIAVVKLQTQPEEMSNDRSYRSATQGQPGIHLTWASILLEGPDGGVYTYPLGTGRAWASPIELTRIYIVAPPDRDFDVQYPRLGADLSGMAGGRGWGGLAGRILWKIDQASGPAYAIDESFSRAGRIWRATFLKSNSDQDIVITRLAEVSPATRDAIRQNEFRLVVTSVTWLISLLVGAALWLAAWRLVMNRVARAGYSFRQRRLYRDAFLWSAVYPLITLGVLILAVVAILAIGGGFLWLRSITPFLNSSASDAAAGIALGILILIPILLTIAGLINAFFFSLLKAASFQISSLRAFGAYMLTILLANAAFGVFALIYSLAVGAA